MVMTFDFAIGLACTLIVVALFAGILYRYIFKWHIVLGNITAQTKLLKKIAEKNGVSEADIKEITSNLSND